MTFLSFLSDLYSGVAPSINNMSFNYGVATYITLSEDVDGENRSVSVNDVGYEYLESAYENFISTHHFYSHTISAIDGMARAPMTLIIQARSHSIKNIIFGLSSRSLSRAEELMQSNRCLSVFCLVPHVFEHIIIEDAVIDNVSMDDIQTDESLSFFSYVPITLVNCKCTNIHIPRFSLPYRPLFPMAGLYSLCRYFSRDVIYNPPRGFSFHRYVASSTNQTEIDTIREEMYEATNFIKTKTNVDIDAHYITTSYVFNGDTYYGFIGLRHTRVVFGFISNDSYTHHGGYRSTTIVPTNFTNATCLYLYDSYLDADCSSEYESPYSILGCHSLEIEKNTSELKSLTYDTTGSPVPTTTYLSEYIYDNITNLSRVGWFSNSIDHGSFCYIRNLTLKGLYGDSFLSNRGISLCPYGLPIRDDVSSSQTKDGLEAYHSSSVIFKNLMIRSSENLEVDPVFLFTWNASYSPTSENYNIRFNSYISMENSTIETLSALFPSTDAQMHTVDNTKRYAIIQNPNSFSMYKYEQEISPANSSFSPKIPSGFMTGLSKVCISIDEKTKINNKDVYDYIDSHIDGSYITILNSKDEDEDGYSYDIKDKDYVNENTILNSVAFNIIVRTTYNTSQYSSYYESVGSVKYDYIDSQGIWGHANGIQYTNWIWDSNIFEGYPTVLKGYMFPHYIYKLFAGDIKPIGFVYNEQEVSTFYVGNEQVWGLVE